jgi:drug/metabolite transporter (DMT)-like permease
VALYTLTAMAVIVTLGYLAAGLGHGLPAMPPTLPAWRAVLLLTAVTITSRLALFMGVKRLGGVQAALIGLSELLVTVLSANLLLGDVLHPLQWLGAGLLALSVLLVVRERGLGVLPPPRPWPSLLQWPAGGLGGLAAAGRPAPLPEVGPRGCAPHEGEAKG